VGEERALPARLRSRGEAIALVCVAASLTAVLFAVMPPKASAVSYGLRTVRASGRALSPTNGSSYWGSPSAGARFVAFQSYASNLASGGWSGADVFVRDTRSAVTRCASIGLNGAAPNGASAYPSISSDGSLVAFASRASNLVADDVNGSWDVFCRTMSTTGVAAVSVSTEGVLGDGDSSSPVLSADGRRVAFVSSSTNLIAEDTAGFDDIFVRDLSSGTTVRVSQGLLGVEANGDSSAPSISADGSKVAFISSADNLVAADTNHSNDVFVVDVATLAVTRASVRATSTQANLASFAPSISGDGRKVAFESLSTNLVSGDTNGVRDVFVRDLAAHTTTRASVSSTGAQGTAESREPSLSHNGSSVAFSSASNNLVTRDTNGRADVFLRNLASRRTIRLSVTPTGQANGSCAGVALSADGLRAVYQSTASNLTAHDTNGRSDLFVAAWGPRTYARVQSDSIYGTAVEASKLSAPRGAASVVVVNGSDWRAAISASALAGTVRGPLLYASKDTLPAVTVSEIARLGASRIFVVGGTTAISSTVASELASIVGTAAVERVGSGDGYSVSTAVASRVASLHGSGFSGTVLVVSGASYKASIACVPLAAASGRPVVFVNPENGSYRLPAGTKRAFIIGGTSSVSASVQSRLNKQLGSSRVVRLSGADQYLTAGAIAAKSVSLRHTWNGVTVVNTARPTEAICGGVMAGRIGSVVLYTSTGTLPSATRSKLASSRYRVDNVNVVGSASSISSSVLSAVKKALGG